VAPSAGSMSLPPARCWSSVSVPACSVAPRTLPTVSAVTACTGAAGSLVAGRAVGSAAIAGALMEHSVLGPTVSASALPGRPQPLLHAGSVVKIQDGVYCVTGHEPLGTGSFGAVWAAECRDGGKDAVAIKEILCQSQKELDDAMLEGNLLRLIHSKPRGGDPRLVGKVPDLVAMETETLGEDQWVMRLAMTKVPGMQLDNFLEMCSMPSTQGHDFRENGAALATAAAVSLQCQALPGACRFARNLLSQLASIFECMSPVVYHRDVSPHNILIDVSASSRPRFGLVDFGLGFDAQSWHGHKGINSWHYVDIGGDCRYWPVSVWIMFVGGSDELEQFPALAQEYQSRLDFHAVGITVLQVLMSLLPTTALEGEEIWSLQAAWDQYWQDATCFWKRTMQVFDSGQDPCHLKQWIRTHGRVVETLSDDLALLRSALRRASDVCSHALPGSSNYSPDAALLFGTLLDLVSNSGKVGQEDVVQRPSWASVRSLIDFDLTPARTVAPSRSMAAPPGQLLTSCRGYSGSMTLPNGAQMQERNRSCSPSAAAFGARNSLPHAPYYAAQLRTVR